MYATYCAELNETHKSLYPQESVAAARLEEATLLAQDVGSRRFPSEESAQAYIEMFVAPNLPPEPPSYVILEASGEGVTVPRGILLEAINDEAHSLVPQGTRDLERTEPTIWGSFSEYDIEIVDTQEDELPYAIRLNVLLDLPRSYGFRLHKLIKANDVQILAQVSLDGSAQIAPARFNQIDEIQKILQTTEHPGFAINLASNLVVLDQEFMDADSTYTPLQNLKLLRESGRIATKMLQLANNFSERRDVISLLKHGMNIAGRPTRLSCTGTILARTVHSEEEATVSKPELIRSSSTSPIPGRFSEITESSRSRGSKRMPPNVPQFVVAAWRYNQTLAEYEELYCYVPITKISSLETMNPS